MTMIKNKKVSTFKMPRVARAHRQYLVAPEQACGLLEYLVKHAFPEKSRTTIKQLLHDRFISVNNESTTQWDYLLSAGDIVTLHPAPLPKALKHKQVEIIWQDEHLVLIHKAPGIPTVSSGDEQDKTALQIVSEHLKKFNPQDKVFLLNRIDKDSAGFVLMAKTLDLQAQLSEYWTKYITQQRFVVAIEGTLPNTEGYLTPPIKSKEQVKQQPSSKVQGSTTAGYARYQVLSTTAIGSLLSIELLAGRNNRLRRQFAEMKRPILGDWRNGSARKDLGQVALDATNFSFIHPITGEQHEFKRPIPRSFRRWLAQATNLIPKNKLSNP